MTGPKRDPRALLATGGLLLIPLAALWLLASPRLARHGGAASSPPSGGTGGPGGAARGGGDSLGGQPGAGTPGEPAPAPPRVAAGDPTQAGWTLLAVSVVPRSALLTPPPALARAGAPGQPEAGRSPFLRGEPGAVGLWIGVRGGVGIKTVTIPPDGRRHAYPLGRAVLVAMPLQPNGFADAAARAGASMFAGNLPLRWEGRGGLPLSQTGEQPPYEVSSSGPSAAPGRAAAQTVTLTPVPFSSGVRVSALPLSGEGKPTGRAVSLLCQPATADALFAQIPAGYSDATRQFRVTVTAASPKSGAKSRAASWLIAGLPPAAPGGNAAAAPSARVGPFALRAVAAAAEDTSGEADVANPHPFRQGGPYTQNVDGHQWTGVPTVRFLLLARAASPPDPAWPWLLQLDRVTPQWAVPPPSPVSAGGSGGFPGPAGGFPVSAGGAIKVAGGGGFPGGGAGYITGGSRPLGLFPLPPPYAPLNGKDWVLQDGAVGAAYPGQPRRLTIQATAIRSAERTETVTFHDAEVVHDAGFGGDRIVWRHPETETTPSGVSVTVLNGRPGERDVPAPPAFGQGSFGQNWWYDRGNAELLLAWRLPPGFVSGEHAALNAPRVVRPPEGAAPPSRIVRGGVPPGAGSDGGGAGALLASWDRDRPDPYPGAAAPPGGVDARPLTRAGCSLLRLSVWGAQAPKVTFLPPPTFRPAAFPPRRPGVPGRPGMTPPAPFPTPFPPGRLSPEVLPPYSWREGGQVFTATPLPRRLKTLTLRITLREEQERRAVRLVVPVLPALPPGADPSAPKPPRSLPRGRRPAGESLRAWPRL